MPSASQINNSVGGIRLGEILVKQGLLSRAQVTQILETQKVEGRPFGVLAEQMFDLDPRAVESAWVAQYAQLAGQVDPVKYPIDRSCLKLINRRQAWQFHLAPVARHGGEVVVFTDEKHLAKALRFAAATFKEPAYFQIVDSDALHELLMHYYPVPEFLAEYADAR
jgi:hypothetical protein